MADFFNKNEIFAKVLKVYSSGKVFVDFIEGGKLFPLDIKLQSLKQSDVRDNYKSILNALEILKKEPLKLIYRDFDFKNIGSQRLPVSIHFESREKLLRYISKYDEFEDFRASYKIIINRYAILKDLTVKKPFLVLKYIDSWSKLLSICEYFIAHPKPEIYIRELSIKEIDTKFIEKHKKILDTLFMLLLQKENIRDDVSTFSNYGFEKKYYLKYPLPMLRFRILDDSQKISGLSDISVNIEEFKALNLKCKKVFVVENKITTLSFPELQDAIVIFGSGYGIEILKDVKWLNNRQLFYWGDIDSDGFAILSQFRGYFPDVKSIFMDEDSVKLFSDFSTKETLTCKKELHNLTYDEKALFDKLQNSYYGENFRLEQEKIAFDYVKEKLIYDNTF